MAKDQSIGGGDDDTKEPAERTGGSAGARAGMHEEAQCWPTWAWMINCYTTSPGTYLTCVAACTYRPSRSCCNGARAFQFASQRQPSRGIPCIALAT